MNPLVQDYLARRQYAYRELLSGPVAAEVLKDLAQFCRANQTCFHPDPRVHAALEGRREVWLRIQQHLNMTVDELYELFGGPTENPGDVSDD